MGKRVRSATLIDSAYIELHEYLAARHADIVVLTFGEIQDLIGFPLPSAARFQADWWGPSIEGSGPSTQGAAWSEAGRSATPNLRARTVTFERQP